jgi:hypothetical protein
MRGHMFRPFGGDRLAVMTPADVRHESSCFADDVVVDFPSVAPAVERIRQAFLAEEHSEPLGTAIQLSHHEAQEGVTVALRVPVRCTCRRCGGRGESWTESCEVCDGTGLEVFPQKLDVTVPAGVLDGTRFQFTVAARHHPPTHIELRVVLA